MRNNENRSNRLRGRDIPPSIRRRRFLQNLGGGFVALEFLDKDPGLLELLVNTPTTIGLVEGQRLRPNTKSGVLVLPAQFVRSPEDVATVITPFIARIRSRYVWKV